MRALWTDATEIYPDELDTIWWEVWLRRHDGKELQRLFEFADQSELAISERRIGFEDRIVILVKGTATQLSASLAVLNDLAEVRKAKEGSAFFVDLPLQEQAEWLDDLTERVAQPIADPRAFQCLLTRAG